MNDLLDLPRGVQESLPSNAQRVWADAYRQAVDVGDGSEATRVQKAWDAVRAQGWLKEETGRWRKTDKRLLRGAAEAALALLAMTMAKAGAWANKQPRVPSGPKGGQWTSEFSFTGGPVLAPGGQGAATLREAAIVAPHLGQGGIARHRFEADPTQTVFVAPWKQTELTGKPAFLDNPEGYVLMNPSTPTKVENNANPEDIATYVPDADPGHGLNGLAFTPWDGPAGGDWSKVGGTGTFDEPPPPKAGSKRLGAGVIVEEPDGRIWTVSPLNQFGGYKETFPKGGIEPGLDLRQTAIKEAFEESGLRVELTGYLGDFERTTSVARYYRAKRIGGDPTDAHWESQAVNAVPLTDLADRVIHHADAPIIAALLGETISVQKALCVLADLIDADDFHATPDEAADITLAKAKGKGGGAWKKQMRVPAGLPTGGQWTAYGSGGIGGAYAAGGVALELQKHGGTGPQSDALNAKIQIYQNAANQGYLHPDAKKVLSGPKPSQTYSSAKYESAAEAKAYVDAYGMDPNVGKSPDAVQPTGHQIATPENTAGKTFTTPKPGEIAAHETHAPAITAQITDMKAAGWLNNQHTIKESETKGSLALAAAKTAVETGKDVYMVNVGLGSATTPVSAAGWDAGSSAKWKAGYDAEGGYHFTPDGKAYTSNGVGDALPPHVPLTNLPSPPKATLGSTIAQSNGKTATGTLTDPMSLAAMTKVADKSTLGGSAAGGVHVDASGQKWLVKSYDTPLQAMNEVAASKIYGALGVQTPQMKLIDLGSEYKGGIGVASKFMDDVIPFDVGNPAHVNAAQANFGAHALLADWDAVGASFDNIMISKTSGAAVLVDPGGSMLFRAKGTPKGSEFKDSVGELNSMRDPATNPTAAKVFGPMAESAIAQTALAAGFGFTDNVNGISKIIDDHMPLADGTKLKTKLVKRAVDIASQGSQLQANLASSAGVGIAKTGTTTGAITHENPHVAQMANQPAKALSQHIDALDAKMADAKSSLSGAAAGFYADKITALSDAGATGDVNAVKALAYTPDSKKALLGPNYSAHQQAYAAALQKAEAVAAQKLKSADAPPQHGSMVTGTAKITTAQVEAAHDGASKMASPLEPSVQVNIPDPTPAPKPVTPQILTPLPPVPSKPLVPSTPANPNTKLIKQNDSIEAINNSQLTGPEKVAELYAISQQLPATGNTYSKKVKVYAANSIAAHGGMHALDTMPKAEKVAALNGGLAKGNAAAGVETKTTVEDLGGGYKLTTTVQTTTTVNPPIAPDAPFDVSTLPDPPNFHTMGPGGGPLYNTEPQWNAINTAAAQKLYVAAKAGKTELDKIDPGTSKHLKAYKAELLAKIDNHAADLKAKMAAWTPTTTKTEILGQELVSGTGQPAKPASAISMMTKGMSNPKNWLVPAAEKIVGFVKVGQIDAKLAKSLHDAIPTVQTGVGQSLAKSLAAKTKALPADVKAALKGHVGGNWSSENKALYGEKGPSSPAFVAAMTKAKKINEGIYDLPVGMTVTRRMDNLPTDINHWNNLAGTVMNHPGIASTSIDGSWSGSVMFKIKATEGVKGAYIHETGIGIGSETELVLPRNTKWVVVGAKSWNDAMQDDFMKVAKANRGGHWETSQIVVEVMAVPHDAPE